MPLCYHPLREVDDSRYDTTLVKLEDQNSVKFCSSYDLSPLVSHIPQVDLIDCQVQNLARWGHPRLFLFLLISYVTKSLVKIFSEKESIEPRIYESWRKLFQELLHWTGTWSQEPFNRDNPLVESGRKTRVFKDYAAAVLSFVPSPLNQL